MNRLLAWLSEPHSLAHLELVLQLSADPEEISVSFSPRRIRRALPCCLVTESSCDVLHTISVEGGLTWPKTGVCAGPGLEAETLCQTLSRVQHFITYSIYMPAGLQRPDGPGK